MDIVVVGIGCRPLGDSGRVSLIYENDINWTCGSHYRALWPDFGSAGDAIRSLCRGYPVALVLQCHQDGW